MSQLSVICLNMRQTESDRGLYLAEISFKKQKMLLAPLLLMSEVLMIHCT